MVDRRIPIGYQFVVVESPCPRVAALQPLSPAALGLARGPFRGLPKAEQFVKRQASGHNNFHLGRAEDPCDQDYSIYDLKAIFGVLGVNGVNRLLSHGLVILPSGIKLPPSPIIPAVLR